MKIDGYLRKVQKIQRETQGIVEITIGTAKYFNDGTDAVHVTVSEYDYRKVKERTGDYELINFALYSFFSKEENDKVLEDIKDYVNTQMAKHHG